MSVRPASTWADTRLVAAREIEEKLRSRAFVLSTLFFLLIVAASIALPALLFDDSPPEYDVATVGAAAESLVEADDSEALQALLAQALARGPVLELTPVSPTLAELYRQVLA